MSRNILNLLPNAVGQGQLNIVYAEVAPPAPTSFSDPLFVYLVDWTTDFSVRVDSWNADHGSTLPAVGSPCQLVKDSRENWRATWWNSSSTAFAPTGTAGGDLSGTYPNPTVTHLPIVTTVRGTTSGPTLTAGNVIADMTLTHTFRGGLVIVYFTCHYNWTGSSFNDFVLRVDTASPPGITDSTYTDTTLISGTGAGSTTSPHWAFTIGAGSHTVDVTYNTGANTSVTAFGTRRQLTVVEY